MIDPLHVGILVPTALGLCCTVGDRRSRSVALWLPAGVMGLAMLDMALGLGLLPALGGAGILVLLSLVGAVRHRVSEQPREATRKHAAVMMVHRSGALILMAVLLLAMAAGPASAPAASRWLPRSRGSHRDAGAARRDGHQRLRSGHLHADHEAPEQNSGPGCAEWSRGRIDGSRSA